MDKKDKLESDAHKNINEKVNNNEEKKSNIHGKPGDVSAKLNFIDSGSDSSDDYETHHLGKNSNLGDDMASFDKTTVLFLQNIIFVYTY